MDARPALMSFSMRIENEAGAWAGSYAEAYVPGSPLSTFGPVPLVGEGAYEGLTAIWWTNLQDPDCECWDPDNQCVRDIWGAVFPDEMPPTPAE